MLRALSVTAPVVASVMIVVLLVEPPALRPAERLPTLRMLTARAGEGLDQKRVQAAVALRFGGLIEAQLRAAGGDSAVFAKSPDGTWAHIPDPDATILARVQTGDEAYRLTTVAPNPAMLKQIFDRLLGRAREVLEVEVPAMPSTSDADLAASLTALLHRLHPVNG